MFRQNFKISAIKQSFQKFFRTLQNQYSVVLDIAEHEYYIWKNVSVAPEGQYALISTSSTGTCSIFHVRSTLYLFSEFS